MNNSATGSYGIGPPDWPFAEAAALTQAQSCTKLPCRVLGADGGLALRNFCSLVQTGVAVAAEVPPNFGTILLVKEMGPGGSAPGTWRDGPTMLYSPQNNEELNHLRGPSDFCLFSILGFL